MNINRFFKGMDFEPEKVPTYRLGDLTTEELGILYAALYTYIMKQAEDFEGFTAVPQEWASFLYRSCQLLQEVSLTAAQSRVDDPNNRRNW